MIMMKKAKIKALALVLGALICVQALGVGSLVAYATDAKSGGAVTYTESFDYGAYDNVWQKEVNEKYPKAQFEAPEFRDGVMYLEEGESARLNWTNIPNIDVGTGTYTMTFDIKITAIGGDKPVIPNNDGSSQNNRWVRELYVALGGYYDQLGIGESKRYNKGSLYVSDTYGDKDHTQYAVNNEYSATVVWDNANGKVTSTLEGEGISVNGTRNKGTTYVGTEGLCSYWVFRCESGSCEISNFSFSDGINAYTPTEVRFSDNLEDSFGMLNSRLWSAESKELSGAIAPIIEGGALKMTSKSAVSFNWTNVNGVGEYDANNTYIFEFDFKITNDGDGSLWGTSNDNTNALFVAPGGYWYLIEFPMANNNVRVAASSVVAYNSATMKNQRYHAEIVWEGTTIGVKITDANGTILVEGSRSRTEFTNMSYRSGCMKTMEMRCEDGAVEIDNFSFTMQKNYKASSTEISIPNGKQAVYSCLLAYDGACANVKMGDVSLFRLFKDEISFFGFATAGSYGSGIYGVTVTVNPTQKMLLVEVELPGGGTIRRATNRKFSDASTIDVYSSSTGNVTGANIRYTDITLNNYTLNTSEPQYVGFGANVFNLVTSFTDARYDRAFAWTALESFIGSKAMAVKYRVAGASDWTVADGIKETESLANGQDYFKADISGLTANTTYEYKIGVKDSDDETNHWSKTYTFRTAPTTVDEFSFIAVGDTQALAWSGASSYQDFSLAQAAFDEAFKTVQDPAFILHTGDIVSSGDKTAEWNMYFKALGERSASIPQFYALGNHDGAASFDAHFNHPNNGGSAAVDTSNISSVPSSLIDNLDETIYSYDYGDVHFIVLHTGKYSSYDQEIIEAQREWLENDLKANADAKWTIILQHQAVYNRADESLNRPWLYDIIEQYGVDLVIQGHSHLVTRTYPMKNGEIVTKSSPDLIKKGTGTVYTTIGSTTGYHDDLGRGGYPNLEQMLNITTSDSAQPAYTEVRVDGDRLVMTIRQLDGLILDTFTIEDRPEVVVEGFQTALGEAENTADVRFVASMKGDYRNYESVGFELTYNGKSVSKSCHYVYEGIMAAGELLDPSAYGADYFFCYTIGDIAEGTYIFEVRAWHKKKGSDTVMYSDSHTVTFKVDSTGIVSVTE